MHARYYEFTDKQFEQAWAEIVRKINTKGRNLKSNTIKQEKLKALEENQKED